MFRPKEKVPKGSPAAGTRFEICLLLSVASYRIRGEYNEYNMLLGAA